MPDPVLAPVIKQLATSQALAALAIHLPDDRIMCHLMWVDADDGHVIFNTEVERAKFAAIEANPNVTLTIFSPDDPYAYAEVRGRVVATVRGDEALAHLHATSRRYTGADYSAPIGSGGRVIVKVAPDRQRTHNL